MGSRPVVALLAMAVCLASASFARAGGDAAAGLKVFNKCRACHDAIGDKNKVGPNLNHVIGRTAGSLETYAGKYSEAMTAAGAGGLVWDEANIAEYVRAPKEKVPGNKMAFAGLKTDEDIANVIAYLAADPKP